MDAKYVRNGQLAIMPFEDMVFANYGAGRLLTAMPSGSFDIGLRLGAANGLKEAVFVTQDVFFASVINMVNDARAQLVLDGQSRDVLQQQMIDRLNNTVVTTPIATGLSVPYTATVALLVPTDKVVSLTLAGIVKDEMIIANPISLPAGWGYKGVKAGAANRLDFTLSLPAIALNGTGTCTFSVYAQRKLVS